MKIGKSNQVTAVKSDKDVKKEQEAGDQPVQ